jgi:UDP-N-acetylglucosamine 1-carboxyvinyltransferase
MDSIVIKGGAILNGEVLVSGSKNAALPLLFSTLLTRERCVLRNVPALADIKTALAVLRHMGARVSQRPDGHEVIVEARDVGNIEAPYDLVKTMRASFLVLGPLLARFGRARVSTPGGCAIGARPVDLHLAALEKMGARIRISEGYVEAEADRLRGAKILLDFPSVGATQQVMMAAALAEGTTVIENAAREPENVCLAMLLGRMGATVRGAGTSEVVIEGRPELGGGEQTVIPDRIEAGTYMVAAAITGGSVRVAGARSDHLEAFLAKLREARVAVRESESGLRVEANGRLDAVDVTTMPHPGFPTDLQAQFMALMTRASGTSTFRETVFENRLQHIQELTRMGARIHIQGNQATVYGPAVLSGAPVMATDLRASMCLVLAGLAARGTTRITRVYHLDRGYERVEEKLGRLGADVRRERQGRGAPAVAEAASA